MGYLLLDLPISGYENLAEFLNTLTEFGILYGTENVLTNRRIASG